MGLTIDDLREYARKHGGECLSEEYTVPAIKLKWKCAKGHTWEAPMQIMYCNTWCPHCYGNAKLSIEQMQEIARERGGECLSEEYVNNATKLSWKCGEGHEFDASPNQIKKGFWCKYCRKKQKSIVGKRRYMHDYLIKKAASYGGKMLSESYTNLVNTYQWECSEGHAFELTAYAVYYLSTWCPHCKNNAKQSIQTTMEQLKTALDDFGITILNDINKVSNTRTRLSLRCSKGHEWKSNVMNTRNITSKKGCPFCRTYTKYTIEDMQEEAKKRGGECISTKYKNFASKLRWKCDKGHEWDAKPLDIITKKSWCPRCAGNGKFTLEDMKKYAEKFGGDCISEEYKDTGTDLEWKCALGHTWKTPARNLLYGHSWCPVCKREKYQKKKLELAHALAASMGGKFISEVYATDNDNHEWECKKGHRFMKRPYLIKEFRYWCPICRKEEKQSI